MTLRQLPTISNLTANTIEDFKALNKAVVVAFFSADDADSYSVYATLAESLRDQYVFGVSNDASLAEVEQIERPSIVVYKDFDGRKDTLRKPFDELTIIEFINAASIPLIGEVTESTHGDYLRVSATVSRNAFRRIDRLIDLLLGKSSHCLYLRRDF